MINRVHISATEQRKHYSVSDFYIDGIAGNLYVPRGYCQNLGVIIGSGALGNRWVLRELPGSICYNLGAYVIVPDPASHHKTHQDFSLGREALNQRILAYYLQQEYGAETLIGGGQSWSAMAGLSANLGCNPKTERMAIRYHRFYQNPEPNALEDVLAEYEGLPFFDGIIAASIPLNARRTVPWYFFFPFNLKFAQYAFHKQNDTEGENLTRYEPTEERSFQFKHFSVKSLRKLRAYARNLLLNPFEFKQFLTAMYGRSGSEIAGQHIRAFESARKIFLVPRFDTGSFGLFRTIINKMLSSTVGITYYADKQVEKLEALIKEHYFTEAPPSVIFFPESSHLLNDISKKGVLDFEWDSLWGLQDPDVQSIIIGFIQNIHDKYTEYP